MFDASEKYGDGKKLLIFLPFVDKTDGNFYMAALEALWNIYCKKRGLIQLGDAQTEYVSDMGGNAVFWYISNPRQRFSCLPIKDSETGGVGAMVVWVSDLTASEKMALRQRSTTTNTEPVKEVERQEKTEQNTSAETVRNEDKNTVTTNKGTPKMVEAEDNKSKRYRY